MNKQNGSISPGIWMIAVTGLFLAGFFLLVVFGAQSYRRAVELQEDNANTRILESYLATAVKGSDRSGSVTVLREGAYAPVLVIADGETGYALHIYQDGGKLLEDYSPAGDSPSPERSQKIAETSRFDILERGNLLELRTDAGRVLVKLRSEEETP